jgi:uncharacterized protein (TIGR02246 family)
MMRPTLLLVSLVAIGCGPSSQALTDADKTAIRAVGDSFQAYFRTDRDSAIANLYTENAILMPPNLGAVEGRAAILAFFQNYPAIPDFTGNPIEVDGTGDIAYVRGNYSYSIPAAGNLPAVNDHGKFLEVRRRQSDGRWLVSHDMFNSDVPVAPAAPPAAPRRRQ